MIFVKENEGVHYGYFQKKVEYDCSLFTVLLIFRCVLERHGGRTAPGWKNQIEDLTLFKDKWCLFKGFSSFTSLSPAPPSPPLFPLSSLSLYSYGPVLMNIIKKQYFT